MKLLNGLNKRIQQIASVRLWLVLTLIMFGLGYAMTSSISPSEELMSLAGGRNVPDSQFFRLADSLYSQLTDYGAHGRRLYLTRVSPVDLFIPLAQALFLSVAITLLFRKVFHHNSAWQLLNTLPFAAMVGDYLENASIVSIIVEYPNRLDTLALAAAFFTAIKFIASLTSIGLIILGATARLASDQKRKMISTLLFTWLQGADFYFDLHKQAVESLPVGNGETWLDIGSGPGLVTHLAAERGYRALGIDTDPQMVAAAKRIARWKHSPAEFQTGDISTLSAESAQVVSAASLLAVLPDREAGLRSLWRLLRPGGTLLIVEPTHQMTSTNARRAIQNGLPKKRIAGLRMWAIARQVNIVDPCMYETLGAKSIYFQPLLQGLVGTWVIQKFSLAEAPA